MFKMKEASFLAVVYLTVHMLSFLCSGQSYCSTPGDIRLYSNYSSTPENEGIVQFCYNGTWYSVCDYSWDCADANVLCRQLGLGNARERTTSSNSYSSFGSWNYILHSYYSCSGNELSLDNCSSHSLSSWYYGYCDDPRYDQAGVRCTGPFGDVCSVEGDIRLFGGNDNNEGILEYCYAGAWSPFCSLGDEEATVACKQLGHYQYEWASILSPGTFSTDANYSTVGASCSSMAVEYSLSDCVYSSLSGSNYYCNNVPPTCSPPVGIRCYDPGDCIEDAIRLVDGVLEQEGRVEVCVDGVWGSICGTGWGGVDGYVLCKQAGFDDAEPTVYTNSEFGDGYGPIVYSNMQCNGWENGIIECPKYEYLQFSCSRSTVSGVLCRDDCTSGDVRLTGGEYDWEGTVEVCFDSLWGTIADAGWDSNDAAVICRQLDYTTNGEILPLSGSFYGKPNRTVHFINVACFGSEQTISQCTKSSYSLEDGRAAVSSVEVAGVQCLNYEPSTVQPCLPLHVTNDLAKQCSEDQLRLVGGKFSSEGRLEFCYHQQWSPFCNLQHAEASVACKQLGYTQYTWAALVTSGEFGSIQNYSLFDNISCSSTASEYSLGSCTVNVGNCLTTCKNSVGIRCFESGTCNEGDARIMDGMVVQEGRVEVCVSGVWGSVCSTGWDTNDANVVCRQLGYFGTKSIPYYDFGEGSGPVIYSNVDCNGLENSIIECSSESYLMFDCPPFEVAGVFCADYCFSGDVHLTGGENEAEGTVEICLDSVWGLIEESGWGLSDARVVCEQLGYGTADAQPVFKSLYGKPNKPIHASDVLCLGDEEELIECTMTLYSLNDAHQHLGDAQVAGVSCTQGTPTQPNTSLTTVTVYASITVTQTISKISTATVTQTSYSVTITSTSTATVYISATGPVLPVSCSSSPTTTAENLASGNECSSSLLTIVVLAFVLITIVVVVGVIIMVVMFKRQTKRYALYTQSPPEAIYTHSSPATDEGKDIEDSSEIPLQDSFRDATGMQTKLM